MEYYNYMVEVSSDGLRLERVIFSYRDEALYFAENRRRQGYRVQIKPLLLKAEAKHIK